MGNKVSCASGNKEDRADARAERRARSEPTERQNEAREDTPPVAEPDRVTPEEKAVVSPDQVQVGTVEISRIPDNEQEELREEILTSTSSEASTAKTSPLSSTTDTPVKEAIQEEIKEVAVAAIVNHILEAQQEEENNTILSDISGGIVIKNAETLELREDIVQRVTIETVQMSMTEYIPDSVEDVTADAEGASSKAAEEVATTIEQYDSPEDRAKARENFLLRFRENNKIHAVDFMRIWKVYDKDKSGFLEGKELTHFIKNLLELRGEKQDKKTIADYVKIIMSTFDYNKDKKLEIGELAQLLPVEHNFLDKFPAREKCTRADFEKVFDHYDKDKSGFVGHTELIALLKDLFQKEGPRSMPMADMTNYADAVFEIYDTTKDGRLSKDELGLVLSNKK